MLTAATEDERKVLFSMLGKLHLAVQSPDPELLRTVLELVAEAVDTKIASDATSRNTLTKLQTTLLKLMHDIASAERGLEETVVEETGINEEDAETTLHAAVGADEEEENVKEEDDEVTLQLRRELETTRIEDPDAEGTRMDIDMDDSMQEYDFSGMADDKDVQELLESMEDEDEDEDL